MRKTSFTIVFLCSQFLAPLLPAAPQVTLSTDRKEAVYACGEEAVFTVEAKENGTLVRSGMLQVTLGVRGGKTLVERSIDLAKENPVRISGTLTEPGFLLASAKGLPDAGEALAGAGFDPEKIDMGNALPDDFRKFWEDGRAEIAGRPVKLEKLDAFSTADYTSYAVTVEVLRSEVLRGFLSIPNGQGPFPAWIQVPGAGPGASAPPVDWAKRGVIALIMNVHKFPVALGDANETKRIYTEHLAKLYYPVDHAGDRDLYHFRNVILGVDRAINEIAARPDWDGNHLVMDGSSQGGGMALIMAGFNSHVTAAAANVPALCDHGGWKLGRQPGWPGLAAKGDAAREVSVYYDAANFARLIHGPVLISAGFIDTTCSPSSIYAAWNQIRTPKKILPLVTTGHAVTPEYNAVKNPWVEAQLGLPHLAGNE